MAKRYRVTLTPEERQDLEDLIGKGKTEARKLARARILLQADEAEGDPSADRRRVQWGSENIMALHRAKRLAPIMFSTAYITDGRGNPHKTREVA